MLVLWLVLGVVLVGVEMHHLGLYALFGALGAFAAAVAAFIQPDLIPLQGVTAVVVATVGVVAIRPFMSKALHRNEGGPLGRGVHGTLVGEEVITLDKVGESHDVGHVRLAGERWLAISGSGMPIPRHTRVRVTSVKGTTLVVSPLEGSTQSPEVELGAPTPSDPNEMEQT